MFMFVNDSVYYVSSLKSFYFATFITNYFQSFPSKYRNTIHPRKVSLAVPIETITKPFSFETALFVANALLISFSRDTISTPLLERNEKRVGVLIMLLKSKSAVLVFIRRSRCCQLLP